MDAMVNVWLGLEGTMKVTSKRGAVRASNCGVPEGWDVYERAHGDRCGVTPMLVPA